MKFKTKLFKHYLTKWFLAINSNYLIINYLVIHINIAHVSQYSTNCKKNELKDMISIKC